jgi:uncharacterized protein
VERGARTRLKDAAALGLMERIESRFASSPGPDHDEMTVALWSACHGSQFEALPISVNAEPTSTGWDGMA